MSQRIAVRAIILDDSGKLFCVRLKAYGGKNERDFWCLPGGGLDPHESAEAAIVREMVEETGVEPKVGALLYIHQFSFEDEEQFELFFHVKNAEDYKNIDLSKASHAEEEIAEFDFIDPKSSHILPEFLTTESIGDHINTNGPTKIFSYL